MTKLEKLQERLSQAPKLEILIVRSALRQQLKDTKISDLHARTIRDMLGE